MAIEITPVENDFDLTYAPESSTILWCGNWDSSRVYYRNQAVFYNRSSWRANKITSDQPSADSSDWDVIAQGAEAGTGGGNSGGGTAANAEIPFSYGDTSFRSIYTTESNEVIWTVSIVVLQSFNATGCSISIGDSTNPSRFGNSSQIYLEEVGEYVINPVFKYASPTTIYLTFNSGTGGTQGNGIILIENNK